MAKYEFQVDMTITSHPPPGIYEGSTLEFGFLAQEDIDDVPAGKEISCKLSETTPAFTPYTTVMAGDAIGGNGWTEGVAQTFKAVFDEDNGLLQAWLDGVKAAEEAWIGTVGSGFRLTMYVSGVDTYIDAITSSDNVKYWIDSVEQTLPEIYDWSLREEPYNAEDESGYHVWGTARYDQLWLARYWDLSVSATPLGGPNAMTFNTHSGARYYAYNDAGTIKVQVWDPGSAGGPDYTVAVLSGQGSLVPALTYDENQMKLLLCLSDGATRREAADPKTLASWGDWTAT